MAANLHDEGCGILFILDIKTKYGYT